MAYKFYVVWEGQNPGIYNSWDKCQRQVNGYKDAIFKGFPTREQAEEAFRGNPRNYLKALPDSSNRKPKLNDYRYALFCDGGCHPNPGPSGTGLAILAYGQEHDFWYGLHEKTGTNNRGELNGMLKALEYAAMLREKGEIDPEQPAAVASDSLYAIKCITTWARGWRDNGWRTKSGGPVQNQDLIEKAHDLYNELQGVIDIRKVKGHSGLFGNECADVLATLARKYKVTGWAQMVEPFEVTYQRTPKTNPKTMKSTVLEKTA